MPQSSADGPSRTSGLEAFPFAEFTVKESAERDRKLGRRRGPESRIGPARDPFWVFEDPATQDDALVEDKTAMMSRARRPASA